MHDFVSSIGEVLSHAQRQLDVAAQNVSNLATPGYKRAFAFERALSERNSATPMVTNSLRFDLSPGKLINTGKPYDLAILGSGFFVVNVGDDVAYTRSGQFQTDGAGRLVTQNGLPVQAENGGDIVLKSDTFKVLQDGSVVEGDQPVARFAVVAFRDPVGVTLGEGGVFHTPKSNVASAPDSVIRQGMLEASNVSTADDMITVMSALRSAEAGQHLANVYDDLMGRVLNTLGQQ